MRDSPTTQFGLVARLRDVRDEQAWAEFVAIYQPLIQRLARQSGLQPADADDLSQEVFRAVATAIGRWNQDPGRGSFRGWLFRIARNLIINLLEDRKRHPRGTGGTAVDAALEQQPAADSEASAMFEDEYRRQLFRWAVGQVRDGFNDTTWQAFWRTAVDNEQPKDAAAALGISVGAVYVYRNRVTARLRQAIEEVERD
jgi:RNA polymerase sigma factor (sigma-70 family)